MKKLLSILLTAAMVSSVAVLPVSAAVDDTYADFETAGNDEQIVDETYDDGTVTNDLDGTQANQVTGDTEAVNIDNPLNEFFLSMDVRFDGEEDAKTSTGNINIESEARASSGDWAASTATTIKLEDGTLKGQKDSKSFNNLATGLTANTWYRLEFEGQLKNKDNPVAMRVYAKDGDTIKCVYETADYYMRNYDGDSTTSVKNPLQVTFSAGMSYDNVKMIYKNPDALTINCDEEVQSGTPLALDYEVTRLGKPSVKKNVTYSLYDADDENPVTEGAHIDNGMLISDVFTADKVVTVRAEAPAQIKGSNTVTATKQVTLKGVNVDNEKFDNISITGNVSENSAKAGTKVTYTPVATKGGQDVTLDAEDVVWGVYDSRDVREIKAFDIENGVLTIPDDTIPQTITVRASSVSGNVRASQKLTIQWSDNQKETVYSYNACEEEADGVTVVESIDGSGAYQTSGNFNIQYSNQGGYTFTALDIKFIQSGSGIMLMRRDLQKNLAEITSDGTNIKEHGGKVLTTVDANAWYHLEIAYSAGDASCNIYKYGDDGSLGERITTLGISTWNATDQGAIRIYGNTIVDNIKITAPVPNAVSLSVPKENMFAGETLQATATASKNDLPLNNISGLTWAVLDNDDSYIIGDDALIKIDANGLLTVDAMAPEQTIKIRVSTASGESDEKTVNIQTSDIFEIKNIGVNEEKTKITKLYVDKKFNYNDDVTFIIAIHGEDGILKGVSIRPMYGDSMSLGSNELTLDMSLPADFDPETDDVDVMVWTTF